MIRCVRRCPPTSQELTLDTASWKQADIHQKRLERQQRIAKYHAEADLNDVLRPRIKSLVSSLSTLPTPEALSTYSSLVSQLRTSPSPDKPQTSSPNQPTYDVMLLHLLEQVQKEAVEAVATNKEDKEKLAAKLHERLAFHLGLLDERTEECRREAKKEEAEASKKITSDGIKEGFSSGVGPLPSRASVVRSAAHVVARCSTSTRRARTLCLMTRRQQRRRSLSSRS